MDSRSLLMFIISKSENVRVLRSPGEQILLRKGRRCLF